MKGYIIFENFNKLIECKEILDGGYTCVISDCPNGTFSGVINRVTGARCNKDDTYDFETGALIALMKMCGVDKVVRACNEAFSEDTFKTYAIKYERELNDLKKVFDKIKDLKDFYKKNYEDVKEHYGKLGDRNKYLIDDINKKLEYIKEKDEEIKKLKKENSNLSYIKSCNESTIKSLENTRDLLINKNNELIEENEKLKLDCEKLQHGYNDMIFCGGRQNGKQYTLLVDLFKKLDQKKVDAAYKEAYNNEYKYLESLSVVRRNSEQINKLTVDSLIEESRAFTRKCVDEWLYKIPTKREEMWEKIFDLHKERDVIIKVKKEDINTFLHELENKIPEITWVTCVKIFETKYTIKDIYFELKTHDAIYFRLWKVNKLSYSSDSHIYSYRELKHIDYLPPMRWDLFKKGRRIIRVNTDKLDEFMTKCSKELGGIMRPNLKRYKDFTHIFVMISDYHYDNKPTIHIMTPEDLVRNQHENSKKYSDKKIVDWEDVR